MTDRKLELGALGYATLLIVVAAMMISDTMTAAQGAWTLVPATLFMVFVTLREKHRASQTA